MNKWFRNLFRRKWITQSVTFQSRNFSDDARSEPESYTFQQKVRIIDVWEQIMIKHMCVLDCGKVVTCMLMKLELADLQNLRDNFWEYLQNDTAYTGEDRLQIISDIARHANMFVQFIHDYYGLQYAAGANAPHDSLQSQLQNNPFQNNEVVKANLCESCCDEYSSSINIHVCDLDRISCGGQSTIYAWYQHIWKLFNAPDAALREFCLAKQACKHGVLQPLGLYEINGTFAILYPYATDGSLVDYTNTTEYDAKTLCRDILKALAKLHKLGIIHNDVKLGNCVRHFGKVYLIDMGMAGKIGKHMPYLMCGTNFYAPPECFVISGDGSQMYTVTKLTREKDTWGVGVALLELLIGPVHTYLDYGLGEIAAVDEGLFRERLDWLLSKADGVSLDAKEVIRKMLTVDPAKRGTPKDILSESWFSVNDKAGDSPDDVDTFATALPSH